MTHTPGPWEVGKSIANDGSVAIVVEDYRVATATPISAVKRGEGWKLEDTERDANARLIAAAPQLLKELEQSQIELEEAAKILEPTFPGMASILRHAVTVHRAAITKAAG